MRTKRCLVLAGYGINALCSNRCRFASRAYPGTYHDPQVPKTRRPGFPPVRRFLQCRDSRDGRRRSRSWTRLDPRAPYRCDARVGTPCDHGRYLRGTLLASSTPSFGAIPRRQLSLGSLARRRARARCAAMLYILGLLVAESPPPVTLTTVGMPLWAAERSGARPKGVSPQKDG